MTASRFEILSLSHTRKAAVRIARTVLRVPFLRQMSTKDHPSLQHIVIKLGRSPQAIATHWRAQASSASGSHGASLEGGQWLLVAQMLGNRSPEKSQRPCDSRFPHRLTLRVCKFPVKNASRLDWRVTSRPAIPAANIFVRNRRFRQSSALPPHRGCHFQQLMCLFALSWKQLRFMLVDDGFGAQKTEACSKIFDHLNGLNLAPRSGFPDDEGPKFQAPRIRLRRGVTCFPPAQR